MAEQFLTLGHKDRTEILEIAALKTGRPAHLLEKDIGLCGPYLCYLNRR